MSTPTDADATSFRHRLGRFRWLVVAGVALVAAALAVVVLVEPPSPDGSVDLAADTTESAPPFALPALADPDETIDLTDYRGIPVVMNIWASWCLPCRREMPALEAAHQRLGDAVAFVGVNHQDDRAAALDLVADTAITYPSAYDPQGVVAYDYDAYGMPTTVFVTAQGTIAGRHTGELTEDDVIEAATSLISEERERP